MTTSHDFDGVASYQKLTQLARVPYDLTAQENLATQRLQAYQVRAGGFQLLYGLQQVDDQVLQGLQDLADEAGLVDQYVAMKEGAILNRIEGYPSEDRQVLHTACRDVFATPRSEEGTARAKAQLERLQAFLMRLKRNELVNAQGETYTTMVQVGIGGSDLGPRALYLALERYALPGRRARFIANVDPDDTAATLSSLDLGRTLFNVVSKSGSTLETLTNERLIRRALTEAGLDPCKHMVAVTGEGSPMDDPSRYLATFHMYDSIGGRYSVTSMVGGVTLGFALGYEAFVEILAGAHAIDLAAESRDLRANLPLLMALLGIWNRNFLARPTVAILPYSQALSRFPAHLQQLDMESNGKRITRRGDPVRWQTGPIVWGEPGTNGQHAFFQLLHQGTEVVPAEFIGFRHSQYGLDLEVAGTSSQEKLVANLLAQAIALATGQQDANPGRCFPGNRPSLILLADQLTPRTMGELLAIYENRVAFQGFCWNINSFDQEGVQLGKVLATRLLGILADRDGAEGATTSRECDLLKIVGMLP